jgi:hypothetical protein
VGPTTRFVVVRVLKAWGDGKPKCDRRRFRRFERGEVAGKVAVIGSQPWGLTLAPCTLLDLSFGGMCLLAGEPLTKDRLYRFLIDFAEPFSEIVLVKARVAWMQPSDEGLRIGLRFVESSKGWLGPEHDLEE